MADVRELEKITVNLIPKAVIALTRCTEREGLTRTDTINRALQIYDYLSEVMGQGNEILLRHPSGGELSILRLI